jgi:hypothetical protein
MTKSANTQNKSKLFTHTKTNSKAKTESTWKTWTKKVSWFLNCNSKIAVWLGNCIYIGASLIECLRKILNWNVKSKINKKKGMSISEWKYEWKRSLKISEARWPEQTRTTILEPCKIYRSKQSNCLRKLASSKS